MNSLSFSITVLLCLSIFAVPRKLFTLPYIVAACLIPMDQRILIAGMDFTTLRFCVLAGFLRLFIRNETRVIQWNRIDMLVFLWMISGSVIFILQWAEIGAIINRSGYLFDGLGLYWLFRQTIRSWDDVAGVIHFFAILVILSAPLILLERIRQSSPYSFLGHSPASFHRGRYRCSGPFPHYIMMGLFWTSLLPWFYACIKAGLSKSFYGLAIVSAILCIVLSGSSTPLMTVIFIIIFLAIYRYRHYGKQITASVAIMLTCLHFIMNNPVWHLMARVNLFGGSTGWHRYYIFDQFINHTSEWFLLGTKDTAHWGLGLADVTNQYVLEAVRGGFITLCIFVMLNILCIMFSGKASIILKSKKKAWLCWGICVSVLGHVISFWGVSYFGQIIMLLYLTFVLAAFVHEQTEKSLRIPNL